MLRFGRWTSEHRKQARCVSTKLADDVFWLHHYSGLRHLLDANHLHWLTIAPQAG